MRFLFSHNLMQFQFEFPFKLHGLLEGVERDGNGSIISWQPHGKAFRIHQPKQFSSSILPQYFKSLKFRSFQRQLQIYGFKRIQNKNSPDYNAYWHELFKRGEFELCLNMKRTKIKGNKVNFKQEKEPDFYREMKDTSQAQAVGPSGLSFKDINRLKRLLKSDTHMSKSGMLSYNNEKRPFQVQTSPEPQTRIENLPHRVSYCIDELPCQEFDKLDLVRYFEGNIQY